MVLVAATVEHDRADAGLLSPVGEQLADLAGLGGLVSLYGPDRRVEGRRLGQGAADPVVHDLREHVPRRPVDDKPRPAGAAGDLLADPQVASDAPGRGLTRTRADEPAGTRERPGLTASHD